MKQRKRKPKSLSLLLAFSLVVGLLTGPVIEKTETKAASDVKIVLNDLKKGTDGAYYTYPDAYLQITDSSKKFYNLTVSVDTGHLKVVSTKIDGVTGNGVVSGNSMNVDFEPLSTTKKYESITFDWPQGTTKTAIEQFIQTIRFTTATQKQTVSMYATSKASASELKTTVAGKEIKLYPYGGHYYGWVNKDSAISWSDAYAESKTATFCGAKGYLATLTSRAEDRFILNSFKSYGNYAHTGWIGATRANLANGSSYDDANTTWQELDKFSLSTCQNNFIWRWVSGPEAGTRFGYQNHAYGDGTNGDGGFVNDPGFFSNWSYSGNIEPNGGANTDEAFAYYGKYEYGRWNDYPNTADIWGYYIEFGGYDGDAANFEKELEQVTLSVTQTSTEIITDGSYGDVSDGTVIETEKIQISGKTVIKNQTTDDEGNPVNKEGTVLFADVTGVIPTWSHDSLTYQWYVKDGDTLTPISGAEDKNYVLTADTVDKEIVVTVTGNGLYKGEISSDPYDTTRTNSDITLGDGDTGNTPIDVPSDKRVIVISPTLKDTIYAIKDENGNVYGSGTLAALQAMDASGNALTPNVTDTEYAGYYQVNPNGTIIFIVDKDKNYIIHEVKKTTTNTEIISPSIPDTNIETKYDDKNTTDSKDDTISLIVDPALTDYKYAVLKKEDGKYVEVTVTKDANGNYVYDPASSTNAWSTGGEGKVTFTGLPASGTYRVVAVSSSTSVDTTIKDISPDKVIGGSKDISVPVKQAPSNPSTKKEVYTKKQQDEATKFIKEHATAPNGKVITKISDLVRDIITSGEPQWKKYSTAQKNAINAKLKALGCPYTYQQLLNMAKKYKIPGFKLKKVMKKKTKAKLKLIKCKGAKIVCTSTNKKVATINKKGVIRAKKVGKATLTFTAIKGIYTNRLVINVVVRKKFKNAKELKNFKSKTIKTPTVLIAKKRKLGKTTKLKVFDLKKSSKVKYTAMKKKVLNINKKGKYKGKKKGSSLVRVKINQNKKVYLLYIYVSIF